MDPDNLNIQDLIEALKLDVAAMSKKNTKSIFDNLFAVDSKIKSSSFRGQCSINNIKQEISVNTVPTQEMSDNEKAAYIVNNTVKELSDLPACKYFTNNSSPNISNEYQYANAAPFHTCSNKLFASDPSSVTPCRAVISQQSCSGYSMDQEIVSQYSIDSTTYFLIKYRKVTGSITYIIADSSCSVYQVISHESSLSSKTNNIDEDATNIFSSYISDLISSKDFSLEFPVNEKQQEKASTSYLSYVLG